MLLPHLELFSNLQPQAPVLWLIIIMKLNYFICWTNVLLIGQHTSKTKASMVGQSWTKQSSVSCRAVIKKKKEIQSNTKFVRISFNTTHRA